MGQGEGEEMMLLWGWHCIWAEGSSVVRLKAGASVDIDD